MRRGEGVGGWSWGTILQLQLWRKGHVIQRIGKYQLPCTNPEDVTLGTKTPGAHLFSDINGKGANLNAHPSFRACCEGKETIFLNTVTTCALERV